MATNGCDSECVDLSVCRSDTLSASICSNETYTFGGQNYSAAGFYADSLMAQNGCDSVVVLDLSVLPVFADTVSASICSNETYTFGGQNYSAAGFYADSLMAQNGCDSVVVLDLSVFPVFADTVSASICSAKLILSVVKTTRLLVFMLTA